MAGTPTAMKYYSAKEILTSDGKLKKCPQCTNENPIDWDKKSKKDDPNSKYFAWQCSECGFQTIASTKPNTQFTLKSCLVDNVCSKLEWDEAESYFKTLGLKVTRGEMVKAFTKAEKVESIPAQGSSPSSSSKRQREETDDSSEKRIKLSDSSEDRLTEIAEYVKVIKEVTEVQKEEIKKMLVAITTLSTTTFETMIKVTELLQDNNDKLSTMSSCSAPPSTPHIEFTTDELLSCFGETMEEEEIILEESKPTPPLPSPVKASSSSNSKKKVVQPKKVSK